MIFPPLLQKNDTVLFISTARSVAKEDLKPAIDVYQSWGLNIEFGKHLFEVYHQFAGTDEQRMKDLQWALDHPTAKAIVCVRGGYGTAKVIDNIDFSNFLKFPKWVIGFSDYTVLHSKIQQLGLASLHAIMPLFFSDPKAKISVESIKNSLFTGVDALDTYIPKPNQWNIKGNILGYLIGGNLSIIHHNIGTQTDVDFSNKVLFIEDIDEYLYHIDRIMNQLDRAQKLKNLAGIIVGHFTDMKDNSVPFGKNAYQIIHFYAQKYNIPTIFGFEAGHDFDNLAIILGKKVDFWVD